MTKMTMTDDEFIFWLRMKVVELVASAVYPIVCAEIDKTLAEGDDRAMR